MFAIIDRRNGSLIAEVPGDSIRDEAHLFRVHLMLADEARLPAISFACYLLREDGTLGHLPSTVAGMASKGVDVSDVVIPWPGPKPELALA